MSVSRQRKAAGGAAGTSSSTISASSTDSGDIFRSIGGMPASGAGGADIIIAGLERESAPPCGGADAFG